VEGEHGYEKEVQEERTQARAAVTAEEEVREKTRASFLNGRSDT
jgi:hypothetical protein